MTGPKRIDSRELRAIIARYDSVEAFAGAVPVSPRAVFYWLSGERKMHPAMAARVRSLNPPNRKEHP
jgi:hypothetical protein